MSATFTPRLDILPAPQLKLWPELMTTPNHFTLYGGSAIALRLGHRQSIDFDFYSLKTFEPHSLLRDVPYLKGAVIKQSSPNTLTVSIDRGGPILLSFFGDIDLGQVAAAELAEGPRIQVASLLDLAA